MTVESATYINGLDAGNPAASDFVYEGDDHMRLIKSALKASFPNIDAAVTATPAQLNAAGAVPPGSWLLQKSVAVSGSPSVIDFVHGSGGVVLNATMDEYLIQYDDIWANALGGAGEPLLYVSSDGGATWSVLPSIVYVLRTYSTVSSITSASFTGYSSKIHLYGGNPGSRCSGSVLLRHRRDASNAKVDVFMTASEGSTWSVIGKFDLPVAGGAAPINAFRVASSAGNFGSYGRVRLFSRKVS